MNEHNERTSVQLILSLNSLAVSKHSHCAVSFRDRNWNQSWGFHPKSMFSTESMFFSAGKYGYFTSVCRKKMTDHEWSSVGWLSLTHLFRSVLIFSVAVLGWTHPGRLALMGRVSASSSFKQTGAGPLFRFPYHLCSNATAVLQGSHASCKVLDFFLDFPTPGKCWKISLVLESPGNESLRSWKVLENEDPGQYDAYLNTMVINFKIIGIP